MIKEKNTRESIIATAGDLILKLGKADISIPQIAKELGVSHAAIYKHFSNKQDLWESVAIEWFNTNILSELNKTNDSANPVEALHQLIWSFIDVKRNAYRENEQMFILNTQYIENNPIALRQVLKGLYIKINQILQLKDEQTAEAEAILSTFSLFTLPNFKETWFLPDFQQRFEDVWTLVEPGIAMMVEQNS
ncbi:TetR/AcrR family transcriptional regulator [Fructobacillus ficulneus]|uniref:Transcriptional regulator n=1 Tax=Fructobacillus ficulneus TaxID=157463 RepID=A0A0K8MJH9_9LACO|nr:TetR/AcrR family transcriptional regulator [Fructobacillus ficulneus]GAP00339.1 transcriptional regulator [Fructobacillus ficulneus]